MSFDHGVLLRFISLLAVRTCWTTFQAKNNIRSAPVGSALTQVSHRSYKACTANRHLRAKRERNGVQRRTKASLVEPWCEHWSCSGWQKDKSQDEAMLNNEEIKATAIAIIKLRLSEGISM